MQTVPYEEFKQFLGPIRPCLICGDDSSGENRTTWAMDKYFKAIECQRCHFITVEPGITPEGLEVYYQNNMRRRLDQKKKMEDRELQYALDKQFLECYVSSGKILDVGCGGGLFLSVLSSSFDKYGIDIDEESIKYGRENFNFHFKNEMIGKDTFENNFFDLIIFRGVIEHMYDPKTTLKRAYELLKKGGKLFFCATPNVNSFCANLYREKWNLWHPIQHINLFTVTTLHRLCGRSEFSMVAVDYPYIGTPYENWEDDYEQVKKDIIAFGNNEADKVEKSPPFWGNMLSLILEKR